VWIQDYDFLEKCTAFVYRTVEFDDCNMRNAFICEIDPKIIINPLAWHTDIVAISVMSLFIVGMVLICCVGYFWYAKSKKRHVQRLERRNSIRQSLRSLNMIDPQGSIRRRGYVNIISKVLRNDSNLNIIFQMNGRSNDSLSKSTGTDYKKMMSNGSIDSMDKSVLSTETSYADYDTNPNPTKYNDYSMQPPKRHSPTGTLQKSSKYGITTTPTYDNAFELSFRNDGFKDNSTIYTNTTRNNSMSTAINEDTPIIHQVDNEEYGSDYYGNASTLPIRAKGENLSFLNELKNRLPEYEAPRINSGHSSFLPTNNYDLPSTASSSNMSSFDKKKDSSAKPKPRERTPIIQTRRPDAQISSLPPDFKRPESYMKAVKPRESIIPKSEYGRPKTLYESSHETARNTNHPPPPQPYSRSKSEALLETNFDDAVPPSNMLSSENRSHSQPLETEF
jgi:hypothetical protein